MKLIEIGRRQGEIIKENECKTANCVKYNTNICSACSKLKWKLLFRAKRLDGENSRVKTDDEKEASNRSKDVKSCT